MIRRKTISFIFASLLFFTSLLVAIILVDGLKDDTQASDVGIVLGSQVLPPGKPSRRLQARLDKTIELYKGGVYKHVIVSGGIGKEGFSEARVMADYLVDFGAIPREAILLDEMGNTTKDTALNSSALMTRKGFESAVVITQYFHISRSKYALRQAGIKIVYSAHPEYFEWRDLYSIAREVIALPSYWLDGFRRQSIQLG